MADHSRSAWYEIQVQGELDQGWENWFTGLKVGVSHDSQHLATTTLSGPVTDQASLRGILCKLWDLNLILISVQRL